MEHWTFWAVGIVGAYIIGALPFGVWVARAKGVNILEVGSGNVGATNVARVLGKGPGIAVFLLDVLKGAAPAGLGLWASAGNTLFATVLGLAAIVGHSASPFLRFRGGKGVATGLGVLLASVPFVALSGFAVFLVTVAWSRIVSLASICAALSLVAFGFAWGVPGPVLAIHAGLCAFVVHRHRANIARLLAGTEPKFGSQKKGADQTEQDQPVKEPPGG